MSTGRGTPHRIEPNRLRGLGSTLCGVLDSSRSDSRDPSGRSQGSPLRRKRPLETVWAYLRHCCGECTPSSGSRRRPTHRLWNRVWLREISDPSRSRGVSSRGFARVPVQHASRFLVHRVSERRSRFRHGLPARGSWVVPWRIRLTVAFARRTMSTMPTGYRACGPVVGSCGSCRPTIGLCERRE